MKKKTVMRLLAVVLAVSLAATSGVPGTALTGIETVYAGDLSISDKAFTSTIKADVTSLSFTADIKYKDVKFAVSATATQVADITDKNIVNGKVEANDAGTEITVTFSGLEVNKEYKMFYDLGDENGWTAYVDEDTAKLHTTKKSIKDQTITLSQDTFTYDGTAKKPNVLLNGVDITQDANYTITYADTNNPINATSATHKTWVSVAVKNDKTDYRQNGTDGTAETVTVYYTINPADISTNGSYIKLEADSVAYSSGTNVKPTYHLYASDGKEITNNTTVNFTESFKNASQVSTDGTKATITLTGTGNYTGSLSASYTVTQATNVTTLTSVSADVAPTSLKVTVDGAAVDTTGKYEYAISTVSADESNFKTFQDSPEFTGLTAGTTYYVAARVKATKNVGASAVKVGTVTTSIADLSEATVTITSLGGDVTKTSSIEYTGSAIAAEVKLTLNGTPLLAGTDYDTTFVYDQGTKDDGTPDNDNKNVGTVKVIIKPASGSKYSGQATTSFTIEKKALIVKVTALASSGTKTYNGKKTIGLTAKFDDNATNAAAKTANGGSSTDLTGLEANIDSAEVGTANLVSVKEDTFKLGSAGAEKNFKVTYVYGSSSDSVDITSLGKVTITPAANVEVKDTQTNSSTYTVAYGQAVTLLTSNDVDADMEVVSVTNDAGIAADYTNYFTVDLKNKTIKCIKATEGTVNFTVRIDLTADAKKSTNYAVKDTSYKDITVKTERATPVITFTGAKVANANTAPALSVLPTESEAVVKAAMGIKAQYQTNDEASDPDKKTYADFDASKLTVEYYDSQSNKLDAYPKAEDYTGTPVTLTVKVSYAGDSNIKATASAAELTLTITGTAAELPASTTPTITAAETKFEDTTTVTIKAADGAAIYYTTDGTVPTEKSTKYTAAFTIDKTTTVKAIAVEDGKDASTVASATFTKIKNGVVAGDDGVNRLYDGDTLVKSDFATIGGKKYYANKYGVVLTKQIITVKGSKYYADKNGVIVTGGKKKTADGSYVYADKNGKLLVNAAKTVSGSVYVADKNGKLVQEGFATVKAGNTYYVKNYKAVKNKIFAYSDGKSYIANAKGVILKGNKKVTFNKKTYYVGKKGAIAKNTTKKISGKTYVFDKKGVLVTNKKYTIGKKTYTVNKKGVVTKTTTKK
jgi:hypothetical protein